MKLAKQARVACRRLVERTWHGRSTRLATAHDLAMLGLLKRQGLLGECSWQ